MKFKRLLTFALAATLSFSALTGSVPQIQTLPQPLTLQKQTLQKPILP